MRTVKDVIDEFGGNAVLFHRHGTYLMNPEGENNPEDPHLLAAMNYSREFPDENNPLDQNGRTTSVTQGGILHELGTRLKRIFISAQGRGSETGLYVGLGFKTASGWMPSIRHSAGCDYPVYTSPEAVLEAENSFGDQFPAHWMNGGRPDLCKESPKEFKGRVANAVKKALQKGGVCFFASHWENVTLVHGLFIEGKDLGDISEKWLPTKSAGVLLVMDGNEIRGFEYDPDFNLVWE